MALEALTVAPNRRMLATANGQPFFWLADTAWELFHRLTLAEAGEYFALRRRQGFNLIQAVALAEFDGLHTPNPQGRVPLCGDDPARPNELYFRDVDAIVRLAAEKELYIGFLPTWGDKVHAGLWGRGPVVFTVENARSFGRFLGRRYRNDSNIVWILGGDRPAAGYEALWEAMHAGLADGLERRPLTAYHPMGGTSSSQDLADAAWLDVNLLQSGHGQSDAPTWAMVAADWQRTPPKPVLDAEPNYEGHPIDPFSRKWQPEYGRFDDYDVRKQAYRSVFAGACGFTYGHTSIFQFWPHRFEPSAFPHLPWREAVYAPGARQLQYLKNLLLSRPYFSRVPADELLLDHQPPHPENRDLTEAARAIHAVATRDSEGSYAMVYLPLREQNVEVDLRGLPGPVRAWWFDPRVGRAHAAGEHPNRATKFTSPIAGPDWVLVLDAAGSDFPPPGGPMRRSAGGVDAPGGAATD
ncbi:MAG: glycoside hydrolase family 140 protein [Planctomycetota bacterium]